MYKDKITEIESLKKQKEEIFANINKSEKEAEKQNRIIMSVIIFFILFAALRFVVGFV